MSDSDHCHEGASIAGPMPAQARPLFRILAAAAAPFFLYACVFALWEQFVGGKPSNILTLLLLVALAALLIQVAVTGRAWWIQDPRKAALAFLVLMFAAFSADAFINGQLGKALLLLATACQIGYFVISAREEKQTSNTA